MADVLTLDLTDKHNPPPDDPDKAPHGWMWDRYAKPRSAWRPRKSPARGGWRGTRTKPAPPPEPEDPMLPFERDLAGDDPAPAYASVKPPKIAKTPPKVTTKTKNDMTAAVGMVGMILLPPITRSDPYCGGALTDNFQSIADALVPLLCRSERVVAFFTDDASDWMLWFKLAIALAPVAVAVGKHHILKTVEIQQDPETGDLYAVNVQPADLATEYPA